MPLKVGALFAGYAGIEIALASVLDVEPAWFAEFEDAPSRILAHRFPGVPNLGDVTKVDWSAVEPVDIITGGSPCQDLSHAGKRAGMKAGTRSGLWASMCDAIDIIRPRLVVWENVRGALSAEADSELEPCPGCVGDRGDGPVLRALGRVLGDLAELGYDSRWYGLRAADVGGAHGRFRIFLFATPAGDASSIGVEGVGSGGLGLSRTHAGPGLPLRSGADTAAELTLLPTPVADNSRGLPSSGTGYAPLANVAVSLLPTPEASDASGGRRSAEVGGTRPSGSKRAVTLATGIEHRWGDYAPAIARAEALFAHRPAPAPTEPGAKGGHRLSARFVEFLMGVPEGWVTDVPGITRNQALKALGNGVAPPQAAAALRAYLRDELRAIA